jgi:hypothetical protein
MILVIPAIIFAVSVIAFAQFGLYYWRATISGIAAQAISDRIRVAAGIAHARIGAEDFRNIIILKDLSPDLQGPHGSFVALRAYYAVVEKIGSFVPATGGWAKAEMALCARYAAVVMDQHLQRNMAAAAQARGI